MPFARCVTKGEDNDRSHSGFVVELECVKREQVWWVPVLSPLISVPLTRVRKEEMGGEVVVFTLSLRLRTGKYGAWFLKCSNPRFSRSHGTPISAATVYPQVILSIHLL